LAGNVSVRQFDMVRTNVWYDGISAATVTGNLKIIKDPYKKCTICIEGLHSKWYTFDFILT